MEEKTINWLTLRQRKFVKGLAEGKTATKAARDAGGYAESTINDHLGRIIGKSRVKEAIWELLEEQGLTEESLVATLKEGLEATKIVFTRVAKNKTRVGSVMVPDYNTRLKFLQIGLKLKGHILK